MVRVHTRARNPHHGRSTPWRPRQCETTANLQHPHVGKAVGTAIGVDEVRAGLLPEDKVTSIKELAAAEPVAMVLEPPAVRHRPVAPSEARHPAEPLCVARRDRRVGRGDGARRRGHRARRDRTRGGSLIVIAHALRLLRFGAKA